MSRPNWLLSIVSLAVLLAIPIQSLAHCDSVAGPVAKDVKLALESGKLDPVVKWIRAADEPELRTVFNSVIKVRRSGGEAASLADHYFLETAVRLHRASEGEPYTGLKPAAAVEEPAPAMVDEAIRTYSFKTLSDSVSSSIREELDRRIEMLKGARAHVNESPARGREYVRSYIELVHYIEYLQTPTQKHDLVPTRSHANE